MYLTRDIKILVGMLLVALSTSSVLQAHPMDDEDVYMDLSEEGLFQFSNNDELEVDLDRVSVIAGVIRELSPATVQGVDPEALEEIAQDLQSLGSNAASEIFARNTDNDPNNDVSDMAIDEFDDMARIVAANFNTDASDDPTDQELMEFLNDIGNLDEGPVARTLVNDFVEGGDPLTNTDVGAEQPHVHDPPAGANAAAAPPEVAAFGADQPAHTAIPAGLVFSVPKRVPEKTVFAICVIYIDDLLHIYDETEPKHTFCKEIIQSLVNQHDVTIIQEASTQGGFNSLTTDKNMQYLVPSDLYKSIFQAKKRKVPTKKNKSHFDFIILNRERIPKNGKHHAATIPSFELLTNGVTGIAYTIPFRLDPTILNNKSTRLMVLPWLVHESEEGSVDTTLEEIDTKVSRIKDGNRERFIYRLSIATWQRSTNELRFTRNAEYKLSPRLEPHVTVTTHRHTFAARVGLNIRIRIMKDKGGLFTHMPHTIYVNRN